jgi:hypothetical protein
MLQTILYDWAEIRTQVSSQAILFGTQQRSHHFPSIPSINISGSLFSLFDKISTLLVTLDSTLSFNLHVSNVCKASYFHLQTLGRIRPILTKDIALYIAVALVQSRLDYTNSFLYRTSSHNIKKLQHVQTMAARLVIGNKVLPLIYSLISIGFLLKKKFILK